MAAVVGMLAADAIGAVTGSVLRVDAGYGVLAGVPATRGRRVSES